MNATAARREDSSFALDLARTRYPMAMQSLRHIAIYVEEPAPGQFEWVLVERSGRSWRELDRADSPVTSYKAAMAQGLVALQARVDDLDVGPRTEDDAPARPDDKGDAGEHRPRKASRGAPAKDAAPGRPYFGFGPAR